MPHPSEPFPNREMGCRILLTEMKSKPKFENQRKRDRIRAVLPVKIWGRDAAGESFEGLAHTLDITPQGGRLGAIHHSLKPLDQLTVQYRQHKMEFRVVWIKRLDKGSEYQIGLQSMTPDREAWGLQGDSRASAHHGMTATASGVA